MKEERTHLASLIENGKPIFVAEISPPRGADPATVRNTAQQYKGKVDALGVSDNHDRVRMSALAAASLVAAEGVEPILHVVTRDRNRIALISDYLGAQALGIHNFLCTSGDHQTLGTYPAAKNVFDLDSVQLLQAYASLDRDASLVGESEGFNTASLPCLGAVASPFADPMELQLMRLVKKVSAGAKFVITAPVFDLGRFETWWNEITGRALHQKVAILIGIEILTGRERAETRAESRPDPMIPASVLDRISSVDGKDAQRSVGIEIALDTIRRLQQLGGVRGFSIQADTDDDAALEVMEKSALKAT